MMLIKWLLFVLAITGIEGLGKLWKLNDSPAEQRIMKSILESCYENDSSSNPILISGDFIEIIDKQSVIRINNFRNLDTSVSRKLSQHKMSKFVLIEDSPEELKTDLTVLERKKWRDHMAPFFIILKNAKTCENFKEILTTTWKNKILNAIYICPESMNTSSLYTLNLMANYAPYPWRRMEKLKKLNIFQQIFNPNISCTNLNYDKTKFLNGYEIRAVANGDRRVAWVNGENYFEMLDESLLIDVKVVQFIIKVLNANGKVQLVSSHEEAAAHCYHGYSDIIMFSSALYSFREMSFLFPHRVGQMVAVVKLRPEMSTLRKIINLWSPPVLIVAAVAFTVLALILMIMNRNDVFLGILDLVRLLIYSSILTNNRAHSFRIYFTTMLILMVISNGVFQGKIAAFLTTQDRVPAFRTIHELVKLKYNMYTPEGTKSFAEQRCPKCNFKEVREEACIEYVFNSTHNVCAVTKQRYEAIYISLPLERVEEPLHEQLQNFNCRNDWFLRNRFNDMIVRLVESGIIDFWQTKETYTPIHKRKALEAEWSSPEYRPIRLYKLKFAFQMLAAGLTLATIVFFFELLVAKFTSN